jgi:hypothetical protein
MPEIRHFEVTEVRTVRVRANNYADALKIAGAAFTNGQNSNNEVKPPLPDVAFGDATSQVRVVDIHIEGP